MAEQLVDERFARLKMILKEEKFNRLQETTVMVVGLGGVGSACAEALARGGIGTLIVIDGDVVSESNINRQAIAFTSTLGQPKSQVMQGMIHEINPNCRVIAIQSFIKGHTIDPILKDIPKPDYVIDCIDSIYAKIALCQWAMNRQIPFLSSMGAANRLDPSYLQFSYLEDTSYCRMSKVMRQVYRELGIDKVEVLYSKEKVVKIDGKGSRVKEHTLGSISYMPPMMGMMLASKVIRRLSGLETYQLTPVVAKKFRKRK